MWSACILDFVFMTRYVADEPYAYFCTIRILNWIPVFIDERYILPIIESLTFTRQNKGMQLFGYVVMPNHLHMIAASESLHANIRNFKRFTSNRIHQLLLADHRVTYLDWLRRAAQNAARSRGAFSFWSPGFHPQVIRRRSVFEQKLRYLHENPMREGLVATPEAWRFSSAGFHAGEADRLLRMDLWDG